MRYLIGLSCEDYKYYKDISFCHADLMLLEDTLINFCDYNQENCDCKTLYVDADESNCDYWYKKLEEICKKATEDDTILFYFAGHGAVLDEDAFLILPNTILGNERNTALSLSKINAILKTAKATGFRIIDACHSGRDVRGNVSDGFVGRLMSVDKSWATLAACSENEYSYPDPDKGQGIFTYYIAEAIESWEKNKEITIEGLKVTVAELMAQWCKDNDICQHPTLNGSIVGIKSMATRNDGESNYGIAVVDEMENKTEMKEEIAVVHTDMPVLWTAAQGIELPKSAEVPMILNYNIQLRDRDIKSIKGLYDAEQFEYASEIIWERSIQILRDRVLALGVEFVGEMVGLDNPDYVRELPAFEVINLAAELGFINKTGKMRLSQSNELVQHYKCQDIEEEMPKNEGETVVRACVQYILGYDNAEIRIEYGDFRNSFKA